MNFRVRWELMEIHPLDAIEAAHVEDAVAWVESGTPLFRIAKPAARPKHLVSYFAVIDCGNILFVDHKNAQLPTRRRPRQTRRRPQSNHRS